VFARGGVQTAIGQLRARDGFAANDVRLDDLIDIGLGDVPVPDGIRIDDQIRAVLALIETTRLVGPYLAFEAAFRQFLFE